MPPDKKAAARVRKDRESANGKIDKTTSQRDLIVLKYLPLVKAIAARVFTGLPLHMGLDFEDLVHSGILGLFDAITKFDTKKQVKFSNYAKHRIKGSIVDGLREMDWASRNLRRQHSQLELAKLELASELFRMPTEAEIAKKLGIDLDRWRRKMKDLLVVGLVSANIGSHDESSATTDFPSKLETHPDSICAQVQLRSVLAGAMNVLSEQHKKVVVMYYTNEMTMKEIGGELGIREGRVSQIHKSALAKMNVALRGAGIPGCAAF